MIKLEKPCARNINQTKQKVQNLLTLKLQGNEQIKYLKLSTKCMVSLLYGTTKFESTLNLNNFIMFNHIKALLFAFALKTFLKIKKKKKQQQQLKGA